MHTHLFNDEAPPAIFYPSKANNQNKVQYTQLQVIYHNYDSSVTPSVSCQYSTLKTAEVPYLVEFYDMRMV